MYWREDDSCPRSPSSTHTLNFYKILFYIHVDSDDPLSCDSEDDDKQGDKQGAAFSSVLLTCFVANLSLMRLVIVRAKFAAVHVLFSRGKFQTKCNLQLQLL